MNESRTSILQFVKLGSAAGACLSTVTFAASSRQHLLQTPTDDRVGLTHDAVDQRLAGRDVVDQAGATEGRKNRPCAIVVATVDDEGDTLVYVAPITHSRPTAGSAVELPAGVKRRLGLDASASWIVTSELNRFIWPGYDLRPISRNAPDVFSWGYLPVELLEAVKLEIVVRQRTKRLGIVDRS
jgi:hypothetical protein